MGSTKGPAGGGGQIDDAPGGGTCMRVVLPSMKVSEEVRA